MEVDEKKAKKEWTEDKEDLEEEEYQKEREYKEDDDKETKPESEGESPESPFPNIIYYFLRRSNDHPTT